MGAASTSAPSGSFTRPIMSLSSGSQTTVAFVNRNKVILPSLSSTLDSFGRSRRLLPNLIGHIFRQRTHGFGPIRPLVSFGCTGFRLQTVGYLWILLRRWSVVASGLGMSRRRDDQVKQTSLRQSQVGICYTMQAECAYNSLLLYCSARSFFSRFRQCNWSVSLDYHRCLSGVGFVRSVKSCR